MNILYCGDKNILDGLLISVLSLLRNADAQLNIFILTMKYETENKIYEPLPQAFADELNVLVKSYDRMNSVTLIDITEQFSADTPLKNLNTRFTPCCMLRLYADEIHELPDRILYLDYDVICRRPFKKLYYRNMKDYEIAGVLDHYGKWFFRNDPLGFDYLNSGVLLLNLKMIRKTGLFRVCRKLCKEKALFMPDQSAINKLSRYKKIVPQRYNEQRRLQNDTVFQHFTTSFRFFPIFHPVTVKPWQIDKIHSVLNLHEYDDLLSEYLKLKDEFTKNKEVMI